MALLEVRNLSIHYGNIHAVKDISFDVHKGQIVTLIGANGAGKSTILSTISGIHHLSNGQIIFKGQNISKIAPYKIVSNGLALCPEGRRVFPDMSVKENLEMGAYCLKDKTKIEENMNYVFSHFPRLKERINQPAGTLSGGEQQMLAMGRALMSNPELLMLDEPSMGLAPILVDEIFDIIKNLNKSGTTILLVEQNANKALKIADQCYVLETGNIVLQGTGKELLNNDSVKKAYLGK